MKPIIVKGKFDTNAAVSLIILAVLIWFSQVDGARYKGLNFLSQFFKVGIYLFGAIIFFGVLKTLFGSTIFRIIGESLVIEKKCLIIYAHRQYQIDKIKNFTLVESGSSNVYWNFGGIRLYQSKIAVSFFYNSKQIIISTDITNEAFNNLKNSIN
jgi:hypothetical protein